MPRLTKNSFQKGINTDIDTSNLPPQFYTEAHGLSLLEDGKFLSLKNIQGTSLLGSITGSINTLIDGNVRTVIGKWLIGTNVVNAATNIITGVESGSQGTIYITVYDLDNSILYYVYKQQNIGTDYFDEHRIVDARVYPENGVDYIYFTDGSQEVRQLRCEIPAGSLDYFVTQYDLSLQRRGANGTIVLQSVGGILGGVPGTLLSGTYQYSYRMCDPTHKKFTKWSALTDPIHVYQSANTSNPVYSAIGVSTGFGIKIRVTPTAEELSKFSYYQLAVVENVYPLATAAQPAALLPITTISGGFDDFVHATNDRVGLIPIEDITVDLAAIKNAKTLAIKQYRLHAGNINYWNLEPDNGSPSITGGTIVGDTNASFYDGFSDHNYSSVKRGYFRDEVYRFGIVYKDKYGNRSPVQVLDMSSITDNQISGSTDMRFPSRATNKAYTLFNSNGKIQSLGLALNGIHNHPTWAVGFEIVRAKRIKRILFQTPLIPIVGVQGVGAFDDYPSKAVTKDSVAATPQYTGAQPQTSSVIYVPKNLFWPEARTILKRTTNNGAGTPANHSAVGEAELKAINTDYINYGIVFPQSSMYGDTPYRYGGFEKFQLIDYCIAKLNVVDFNTGVTAGEAMKTQVSGTFYSLSDGDYYFDSGWTAKTISTSLNQLKDFQFVSNASPSVVIGGNKIFGYDDLDGQNVNWGYKPSVQRCAVIEMGTAIQEPILSSKVFANGTLNAFSPTTEPYIVDASGPRYETNITSPGVTNTYIHKYTNFVNNTSYVQCFDIINVVNDYGDSRYGDTTTNHDFISTGATYTFSPAELTQVQAGTRLDIDINVFGGDCFVAPHTFKVADSAYSVVEQGKNWATPTSDAQQTLLDKWDGKFYATIAPSALSLPVAVQGAAQFVEIVLESEYNGGVMNNDITTGVTSVNGIPVMNLSATNNSYGATRSPLTYVYNINLSKQNDQKVYVIKQPFSFIQYNFKSRDNYSDIKIYGSDVQGFDVFRVGNVFDLEENKGALTKLAVSGDLMYAIQETGVVFLPTSQNQLQQTDGGTLTVGTDLVIGRPIIIDQNNGGQHMNAIVETGSAVYIADVLNKGVYRLKGTQPLEWIHDNNFYTSVRSYFSHNIPENQLIGFYNQINKEFWLVDNYNNVVNIFNENIEENGAWVGDYEFYDSGDSLSSQCVAGVYGNQNLHLVSGLTSGGVKNFGINTMYTGANDSMFGRIKTPRVTISVNPDSSIAKTFDDMCFIATDRLATMDLVVEREASLSNQIVNNISLDSLSIEGNYRVKTLRDAGHARLRGTKMLATIKWKAGNANRVALTEILTKYRWSARSPF